MVKVLAVNAADEEAPLVPIDNLLYKTFVKKFNDQYNGKLIEEQKELLSRYIASFHDDGIELKIFLNEELTRLKGKLSSSLSDSDIVEDSVLHENTKKVLSILNGYNNKEITTEMIQQVLKIQNLVEELND